MDRVHDGSSHRRNGRHDHGHCDGGNLGNGRRRVDGDVNARGRAGATLGYGDAYAGSRCRGWRSSGMSSR